MPTRNLPLPGELERTENPAEYALRLDILRRAIEVGLAALERGEYTDVEEADLVRFSTR